MEGEIGFYPKGGEKAVDMTKLCFSLVQVTVFVLYLPPIAP
jgi:hypothetical protein